MAYKNEKFDYEKSARNRCAEMDKSGLREMERNNREIKKFFNLQNTLTDEFNETSVKVNLTLLEASL